jgi:hypothetical protein
MRPDRFGVSMIPVPFFRLIILICVLATAFAPTCRAEKLTWYPKLVHRQLGGGWTLALELGRRPKTFFLCAPTRTDCVSTKEVGWRKPFIIARGGSLVGRDYKVVDTSRPKAAGAVSKSLASELKTIPLYPAAVAWEKLSPARRLW